MAKYRGTLYTFKKDPNHVLTSFTEEIVVERGTVGEIDKEIRPYIYGQNPILQPGTPYAWFTYNVDHGRITNISCNDYNAYQQMVDASLGLEFHRAAVSRHYVMNEHTDETCTKRVMFESTVPLTRREWSDLEDRARISFNEMLAMKKPQRMSLPDDQQAAFRHGSFTYRRWWFKDQGFAELPIILNYD